MAILKCKMCGGDIQINSDQTYGTCDSCGSVMTLPKASDERTANLFNRANHFRRLNDFDKALSMYEDILNEDNTNAEAHWGIVLARYGIEYVEDPKTQKRIPTCNRTQFSSILSDADYLAALDNAEDAYTRSLYEEEALQISEIQKRILTASNNLEPFDVFICYKEKTNGGSRTPDSVLAQDVYFQLTKIGYKVFFARITLEDKLGIEYEPYIFAALNSAKVMTVIGTKKEHFNAVWVKNEWSRFLALMQKDSGKLLIPCFKDMDPYDLPDELSMLQSQDMSKIGFMQDLITGIKKVLDGTDDAEDEQSLHESQSGSYESLLERGFICLEDGLFPQADSLFEQVLNINPKCAKAYIGKLLAERNLCLEDDLLRVENSVENSPLFKRALLYADNEYKQKLLNMKDDICERLEEERKQGIYESAIGYWQQAMPYADSDQDTYIELLQKAIHYFDGVKGYKDSDERIEQLTSLIQEAKYQCAVKFKSSTDIESCEKAITLFSEISEYKDSRYQITECKRLINEIKYQKALEYKNKGTYASLKKGAELFAEISDFNDADVQRKRCEQLAKEAAKREQEQKRKTKIVWCVVSAIVVVAIVFIIVLTTFIMPGGKYNNAAELAKQGEYDQAISIFADLKDYRDSQTYMFDVKVMKLTGNRERPTLQDKQQLAKDLQARVFRGNGYVAALKNDGTVLVAFEDDEAIAVEGWTDIVQISTGHSETYGLRSDGTVLVDAPDSKTRDAETWNDIKEIASGDYHIVGLKADGTVVAVGDNDKGQCDVSGWTNIENVFAFNDTTLGLKQDGSVVAAGEGLYASNWNNIDAMQVAGYDQAALMSNGTVSYSDETSDWDDIVHISLGRYHLVGVRSDGTVVADGLNSYREYGSRNLDVQDWKNMIAAYAYGEMTMGIRNDGTVTWVGDGIYEDFSDFNDVIALYPIGDILLGLKTDGTFAVSKDYYEDDFKDWNLFDETSPIGALPEPLSEEAEDKMANLLIPTLDARETFGYMNYSAPSSWKKVISDDELIVEYFPTDDNTDGYIRLQQLDFRIPLEEREDEELILFYLENAIDGFAQAANVQSFNSEQITLDGELAFAINYKEKTDTYILMIQGVIFESNGFIYVALSINDEEDRFREDIELPYITLPLVIDTIKKVEILPDFLDDSEVRSALVKYAKAHEYEKIIDLASAYTYRDNLDENDSVYAIKEAAEKAKEAFEKCQLIEDEFSQETTLYGDVIQISNDTNFVPYIGNERKYSFELMAVRVGFEESGLVFFEKTSIKTDSGYIDDSYSYDKVIRDVISGGTIREYTTLMLSASDALKIITAENPYIRFSGVNGEHHDHKLTESEIESLSKIYDVANCEYIINQNIDEWETINK